MIILNAEAFLPGDTGQSLLSMQHPGELRLRPHRKNATAWLGSGEALKLAGEHHKHLLPNPRPARAVWPGLPTLHIEARTSPLLMKPGWLDIQVMGTLRMLVKERSGKHSAVSVGTCHGSRDECSCLTDTRATALSLRLNSG